MDAERFNEFFKNEAEARFAWGMWCILTHGIDAYMDKPLPPMPHERNTPFPVKSGTGLFSVLKDALTVEEVARRFTTLSGYWNRGDPGMLKGKCPLHAGGKERTPSFVVYTRTPQRWQCFGACAGGGDVIELYRQLMDKGLLK